MMPEIRNTKSACLTAPAKIQPKSRMTGSETSWIQRGTRAAVAFGAGPAGAEAPRYSC